MKKLLLCAVLLAAVVTAGCASRPKDREKNGEYTLDAAITKTVRAALASDAITKNFSLSVDTFKGTVQLSGYVDTEAERDKARRIALRVEGVKYVSNNITLRPTL